MISYPVKAMRVNIDPSQVSILWKDPFSWSTWKVNWVSTDLDDLGDWPRILRDNCLRPRSNTLVLGVILEVLARYFWCLTDIMGYRYRWERVICTILRMTFTKSFFFCENVASLQMRTVWEKHFTTVTFLCSRQNDFAFELLLIVLLLSNQPILDDRT